jgi:osmotically-inducible protein OsmY
VTAHEAFRRNAELGARRITVEVDGDKVYLHGAVRSWTERDEAERTAWSAPGVSHVDNQIVVTA